MNSYSDIMEELLTRHRKEQRDLQSKITQKKKSASKKTRKGVNDECAALEQDLKTRQKVEIAALTSGGGARDASSVGQDEEKSTEGENGEENLLASITSASTTSKDDLVNGVSGLRISSDTPGSEDTGSSTQRKPNRQKVRLAKRAAEQEAAAAQAAREAASQPDLKAKERAKMVEEFTKRGLKEKVVAANGHCMYLAVADQMRELGLELKPRIVVLDNGDEVKMEDYRLVRTSAAEYITGNAEDFVPFLEEPLDEYVRKIRDTGEWGGQLELMALAKTYDVNINVLQGEGRLEKIEGSDANSEREIWLAYYRHGFGLGEHYNSLRKAPADAKS